jgi:phosphotransferase system enzyme I (PtsI)
LTAALGSILKGIGVGDNSAVGEVLVISQATELPEWTKSTKTKETELSELNRAIQQVSNRLDYLRKVSSGVSSEIFEAQKILLSDSELLDAAVVHIENGWGASAAFGKAIDEFSDLLSGEKALEERVTDLQDLSKKVQASIAGIEITLSIPKTGSIILVGEDFSPADTAQFTEAVVGVITYRGGPTSHTAIICRSKSIATLVCCPEAQALESGTKVLIDPVGNRAVVGEDKSLATKAFEFVSIHNEPLIPVRANIGSLDEAIAASQTKANGVGLFRTELLYLAATSEPDLAQQVDSYTEILKSAPVGPVVIRTLDAGGDKKVPFLNLPEATHLNQEPEGYRLLVTHRKFLELQLQALELARLAAGREVWVMAPMIATLDEARSFSDLARSIGGYQVGITVETPSIAAVVADLEELVDFVSVGTNDLAQYLFASNRTDSAPSSSPDYWHPQLIALLAKIAYGANTAGISSAVCGESASDPLFAIVLAGLGIESVSVSKSQVTAVHSALCSISESDAKEIASEVLKQETAEAAQATAQSEMARR